MAALALAAAAFALVRPEEPPRFRSAGGTPFPWDRDGLFRELEREFRAAAGAGAGAAGAQAQEWMDEGRAALGVRHYTALVPSDLEYDPSLTPVAEWRNPRGVAQDRVDGAILDALLEAVEGRARLGYAWWELPLARLAKGWSVFAAALGADPLILPGMWAGAALRGRAFTQRVHPRVREGWEAREARTGAARDLYPALRVVPAGP